MAPAPVSMSVVVTGATGALGRVLTGHLIGLGARVAASYRDAGAFRALQQHLGSPAGLFGIQADVSQEADARRLVEEASRSLGSLDGLALVAGGWAGGRRFDEAAAGEWAMMLGQNLDTARHVCRFALPQLRRTQGSVVAVGSRAAASGGAGMASYAVAKSALHALVRVLADENRDHGVRFNAVLPGTIDTPANRAAMPAADRAAWTPPEAIARSIAFLLSADSRPVTGAFLPV